MPEFSVTYTKKKLKVCMIIRIKINENESL